MTSKVSHTNASSDGHDDGDLLIRLAQGDEAAFNLVVNEYAEALYRFAFIRTQDQSFAEDAVQDVLVYIWKSRESLVVRESLKSYLYRAVANRTVSMLRSRKSQERVEQAVTNELQFPYNQSVSFNDAEARLEAEELQEIAQRALSQLPPRTREIFLLSREQGLSYTEISAVLNIGVPTIRNQVSRAAQTILAALEAWEKDL